MKQIICDVCGSKYDEAAESCPVCGMAPKEQEPTPAPEGEKPKGGHFSKANVRRRKKAAAAARKAQNQTPEEQEKERKRLLIIIAALCTAIVLVSAYIGLRFFWGGSQLPTDPIDESTEAVPCAGIVLESGVIHLEQLGQEHQLAVRLLPQNTTEAVTFSSSDEAVVTVSETGLLTVVGAGQAEITVTCGSESKICTIVCWLQETTAPPETTVPETTVPETTVPETTAPPETTRPEGPSVEGKRFYLNQSDVTFYRFGQTYQFKAKLGGKVLDPTLVTWTSSDPNIATIEDGLITVLGKGDITITASYGGKSDTCIVRCQAKGANWQPSQKDVTLKPGEKFTLTVVNSRGDVAQDVIWTMDREGVASIEYTEEGLVVTGRIQGEVTLTATVAKTTVTCIVRVG